MMRRWRLLTPRLKLRREREFSTEFEENTEKKKNRSCSADYNVRTLGRSRLRPYIFCGDGRLGLLVLAGG